MLSSRPGMQRYAAIGLVVMWAGCFGPKSHDCESGGATWVCPQELACANPPTYCANPLEVNACDGKPEAAPCRTDVVPDGICVDNACQMCSPDIEGCRSVGWNPMTVPGDTYTVVYAAGSGDAWAAGGSGELLHYDGAHWEPDATFTPLTGGATVASISGTSSAHLFAMASNESVFHQSGGTWVASTTSMLMHGVWADGDDSAFAVGLSGDVERFASGTWTQLPNTMTTTTLRAVWGTSATNVYAVGGAGTTGTVIHYNGSSWTASTVGAATLDAVWGSGPNDIYVGGAAGIYHSTDGSTWTPQGSSTSAIQSIWGSSATDVFETVTSVGILHSDGTGLWVPLISPASASSISGSGPADVFAAAGSQIVHYTGAAWSTALVGTPTDDFQSIWAASPSALFAASNAGLDRYDGVSWTKDTSNGGWHGVWARASDDAYAVGGGVTGVSIDHWDGSAWSPQTNPSSSSLFGVTGTSTMEYAIGESVISGANGTWTAGASFPNTASENAIWVSDDGTIFAAGDQLYTVSGGTANALFGPGETWNAIWGTSASDVFAAGLAGQIRHYDGTSWSEPMDVPTTVDLNGLWGTSDDDVFAVGATGTILHYHAQLWTMVPPPPGVTATFMSVAGSGSTIFIAGANGTVARLIESAP